ncbi:MAG: hypothetical protein RLZZ480_327 [Candidatus Parcubacteria bacterium]|jgi:O-antigen/teichoic acid export membrane protein
MYTFLAAFINKKLNIDAHYFLKGGFWMSVGQGATIFFGLISTALFAYFLNEHDYGVYRYLIGIAVILSSFSLTGLGQSIIQTAAKKMEGFYIATIKVNFLYGLAITVAGLVGFGYYWLNENSTLAIGCLLIAVLQPIISTYQNTNSLLQGSQRFRELTILNITRSILSTAVGITTLLVTQNVLFLFLSYLLTNALLNITSHLIFKPKTITIPNEIFNKYLAYAKHTSIRNFAANIAQRADTIIIFTQLGAAELALYSIAIIIPEQIKGSAKNLAALLLPKYAQHENQANVIKSIPKRSLQLFILLVTITIVYILVIPLIYQLLFPKYPQAAFLSQLLALSFPAMVAILPGSILQSQLQDKKLYKSQILETVATISLSLILTLKFGVVGAILSKVTTRYLTSVYHYLLVYRD